MSNIGIGSSNTDNEPSLDFSSFPLLRIDQLSQHETETLIASKNELSNLLVLSTNAEQSNKNIEVDMITKYAYKLHEHIVNEIENREAYERVTLLLSGKIETPSKFSSININNISYSNIHSSQPLNPVLNQQKKMHKHERFINEDKPIDVSNKVGHCLENGNLLKKSNSVCHDTSSQTNTEIRTDYKKPIPIITKEKNTHPIIFVSGNQNQNVGFKYRAKAARLRLKARSFHAIEMQKKAKIQFERDLRKETITQRVIAKQKKKEEKLRKMIELKEKREQRKMIQEAKKKTVVENMKMAAECAKQKAWEAGKSAHEAVLEAAAAAAEIIEFEAEIDSHSEESLSEDSFDCNSSYNNHFVPLSTEKVSFDQSKDDTYISNITTEESLSQSHHTHTNDVSCNEALLHQTYDCIRTEGRSNKDNNQLRTPVIQKRSFEQSLDPSHKSCLSMEESLLCKNLDGNNSARKELPWNSNKEYHESFSITDEKSLCTKVVLETEDHEKNQTETSNLIYDNHRELQSIQVKIQDLAPKTKCENREGITVETKLQREDLIKSKFEIQPICCDSCQNHEGTTSTHENSKSLHPEPQQNSEPKMKTYRINLDDFICDEISMQVASTKKKIKNLTYKENNSYSNLHEYNSNAIKRQVPKKSFEFADQYTGFHKIFTAFYVGGYRENTKEKQPFKKILDNEEIDAWLRSQWKLTTIFERVMFDLDFCEDLSVGSNKEKSENDQKRILNSCRGLYYRIGSIKPEVFDIINDSLSKSKSLMKWKQLPTDNGLGNSWNLLWTWSKPKINFSTLLIFQKVNHFQNSKFLTRKDLLKKKIFNLCSATSISCLGRMQRSFKHHAGRNSDLFHIMPQTYILPQEYNAFVSAFVKTQSKMTNKATNFWILKPTGLSRGRGISLINDIGNVSYADSIIMQEYIMKPLLIDGYKFDLRLYVFVSSFNPLEAFIYREGFARFGSNIFSTLPEDKDDERIHLTNSSIQQKYWNDLSPDHPVKKAGSHGDGNKVSLTWLWMYLEKRKYNTKAMWKNIFDVCIKTLVCVEDEISFQPNAFEVYGFDIMFDDSKKPWLIEVNSSPSMSRETNLDIKVKEALISDTINLLDPPSIDRKALQEICNRRTQKSRSIGLQTRTVRSEKEKLDADLRRILMNKLPRQYGKQPSKEQLGNFVRLAPGTSSFESIKRMKRYVLGIKAQNVEV